jgi:DNA-binding HxlR family transcriptional regulator
MAKLEDLASGDVLTIDAKGVEVFDYSFANELFGKTLFSLSHEHPGRFLIVENLTPYIRENLGKALESMGLAIIERKQKKLNLLGKVNALDEQTFQEIARAKGPVTSAFLKERLSINLNAANERLSKLTNLALIRRQSSVSSAGREQYEYSLLS